ncbi:hypothetical protein CPB86DRAFT_785624, partial [Serendipita vermifera]
FIEPGRLVPVIGLVATCVSSASLGSASSTRNFYKYFLTNETFFLCRRDWK